MTAATKTKAGPIVWSCDECGGPIAARAGYIHVSYREFTSTRLSRPPAPRHVEDSRHGPRVTCATCRRSPNGMFTIGHAIQTLNATTTGLRSSVPTVR